MGCVAFPAGEAEDSDAKVGTDTDRPDSGAIVEDTGLPGLDTADLPGDPTDTAPTEHTGEAADTGAIADTGGNVDTGGTVDTGGNVDTGEAVDTGGIGDPTDTDISADTGIAADTGGNGGPTDTGEAVDTGGIGDPTDTGAPVDTGAIADSGAPADSGNSGGIGDPIDTDTGAIADTGHDGGGGDGGGAEDTADTAIADTAAPTDTAVADTAGPVDTAVGDTAAPVDTAVVDTGAVDTGPAIVADHVVCADGSADFTEIQAAIDASSPGDTIAVCPGVYGPIAIGWSQELTIVSTDGPEATTIDGGADTAVFVVDGTLALRGFTLTGTGVDKAWETDRGGALTVKEGEVTVSDCIVRDVTGDFGMVFDEDLLVMEDVRWIDNTPRILWFLWQGDDLVVTRNTVTGGVHQSVILAEKLDQLHIRNSVFSGITIDTAFTAFDLATTGTGPMVLENNVFYDIDDLDPWGGRIFSGVLDFRNNVVMDCHSGNLVPFDASYSIFWNNQVSYAPFVTGTGNLFVDPLLADPANGDVHPSAGSPAIDAGDPDPGQNDPDGTRNDIGRYGGPHR